MLTGEHNKENIGIKDNPGATNSTFNNGDNIT